MTCMPSLVPSSASASPIRRFKSSASTTQGPAIRNGVAPKCRPIAQSPKRASSDAASARATGGGEGGWGGGPPTKPGENGGGGLGGGLRSGWKWGPWKQGGYGRLIISTCAESCE